MALEIIRVTRVTLCTHSTYKMNTGCGRETGDYKTIIQWINYFHNRPFLCRTLYYCLTFTEHHCLRITTINWVRKTKTLKILPYRPLNHEDGGTRDLWNVGIPTTTLHSVTTKKTSAWNITTVKTSKLAQCQWNLSSITSKYHTVSML